MSTGVTDIFALFSNRNMSLLHQKRNQSNWIKHEELLVAAFFFPPPLNVASRQPPPQSVSFKYLWCLIFKVGAAAKYDFCYN